MLVVSCTKYKVQCTTNNKWEFVLLLCFQVHKQKFVLVWANADLKNCKVQKACDRCRNLFPETCRPVQEVWSQYSNLKTANDTKICLLALSTEIKKKNVQSYKDGHKYNNITCICNVSSSVSSMYLHPFQHIFTHSNKLLSQVLKVQSHNFHTVTAGSSPADSSPASKWLLLCPVFISISNLSSSLLLFLFALFRLRLLLLSAK